MAKAAKTVVKKSAGKQAPPKATKPKAKSHPQPRAMAKRAAVAPALKAVKKPAPVAAKPQAKVAPKAVAKAPAPAPKKVLMSKEAAIKQAIAAARPAAAPARTIPAAVAKTAGNKIIAPAAPAAAAQAKPAADKKPVNQRHGFKTNEWIVYPAHGVGRIVAIEEQEIAGLSLELFVITFDKDKMTLRVPTGKSQSVGMRKLAEEATVKKALETLKGRARIKRTMWSRRAQEYEAKINSGDLVAIAEVVRDLYRSENQPEQSYSERQLYEAALDRMAREIAAVEKLDERGAVQRVTEILAKSARGRRAAAEDAEVQAA
jgi:CarD family transcriptional regulator